MSAVSQNSCLSGMDFGNSLDQGNEELWHSRNSCLSGSDFGDSLSQGDEELWRSQNLCLSVCRKCLNFVLWVSFLAGVINWK